MLSVIKNETLFGRRSKKAGGTLLVHCSDGSGRTGVFLALGMLLLSQQDEGGTASLPETVLQLRSQRMGMVSTKGQYDSLRQSLAIARAEKA